jgi:hypothetical protein
MMDVDPIRFEARKRGGWLRPRRCRADDDAGRSAAGVSRKLRRDRVGQQENVCGRVGASSAPSHVNISSSPYE